MKGVLADRVGGALRAKRDDAAEMNASERASYITWLLTQGGRYSNDEVAALCGLASRSGAWRLMQSVSRVAPVRTGEDGRWEMVHDEA